MIKLNNKKRILSLIAFASIVSLSSLINKKEGFFIEYSAAAKTITINDTIVTLTEYIDDYDNPVSAVPSSRKEVSKKTSISRKRMVKLMSDIRASGFMKLQSKFYGASEQERYYPYTIKVRMDCIGKEVIYRSNPSTPAAPGAFSKTEKLVNDLIEEIKNYEK
jgi:hypothetical protein